MATLPESIAFTAGIYQLETTDPVLGGAGGVANQQATELADRTLWLRDKVNRAVRYDSMTDISGNYTVLTSDVNTILNIPDMSNCDIFFPLLAGFTAGLGRPFTIKAGDAGVRPAVVITASGSDVINDGRTSGSTYSIRPGQTMVIFPVAGTWHVISCVDSAPNTRIFPGTILQSASAVEPDGYLLADGDTVSRSTYAELFVALGSGSVYGVGDGSTTFHLPDYRGYFLRSLNSSGSGVDPSRALGSIQQDDIEAHTHQQYTTTESDFDGGGRPTSASGGDNTSEGGGSTGSTGGTETRPKNISVNVYIKY